MTITDFISEGYIVLVVVLNIIGKVIKDTDLIPDKYIPIMLMGLGGILGIFISIELPLVDSIFQGILCSGVAIMGNQTIKQLSKGEDING